MMGKIKYLAMDVDGTLTDGKIYMGMDGEACKAFDVKDGCGIHDIAIPNGIIPIIITGRKSEIVSRRCKELEIINVYQGVKDKLNVLSKITADFSEIAYIGDDINDLQCMTKVKQEGGLVGCPNDAVIEVKNISDFISEYNGGAGAVRQYIEYLIKQ